MHEAAKPGGAEPSGAHPLRERAERLLREAEAKREAHSARDGLYPLRELRLHRIELELQNEQLRTNQAHLALQNDRLRSAERALAHSRAQYQALFDLAPAGYVTLDASGVIVRANRAAEALLGAALAGRRATLAEFTQGADLRALRAHLRAAASAPDACELRLRRTDGSSAHARVESRPAPGGGCLTMLTDISDSKRAEEALSRTNRELVARTDELAARNAALQLAVAAQEASEAERRALAARLRDAEHLESVGLVAGGIAHDFNNLLVGVMANADVLLETRRELAAPARAGLQTIKRATRSAADLARQLLVYAGRGQVTLRPVPLDRAVHECLELLQARVPPGVTLLAELGAQERSINADAGQLQQVVGNLVTNGMEAIGDGGGRVIVRTRLEPLDAQALESFPHRGQAKPGLFAVLQVEDTGMGIDAGHLSRIFEPFFSSKFTGRGLGLASVRGVVRSHDAALRVQSEPGRGSSFEIAWPLAAPCGLVEAVEPRVARHWQPTDQVLIVDDDPTVRGAMAQQFAHFGFSVTQAASGPEAVELFQAEPSRFRLAVVDQTMPGLSGERVIERLHRLAPALPVVLVSGYSAAAPVPDDDCVAFVAKPMTLADLQQAISRLLDRSIEPGRAPLA